MLETVPMNPAPRKIVCLETYWADHDVRLFRDRSVLPFLNALAGQFDPPLRIAHRFVDSLADLSYYASRPDGLLWRDSETFDAPVFYLSFHGAPGTLLTARERIGPKALLEIFAGWGEHYPNLVHFGACRMLADAEGQQFAQDFLAATRCRGITGYTSDVDWMESMAADLLFLRRFFLDEDPWSNLRRIHDSMLEDFTPARRLGCELHLGEFHPGS
jgi:hypothetical protein